MNCKQARNLFSARVDGELTAEEFRSLEAHLQDCREGCLERWMEFEATVRLVHSLPPVEPDPNFVGQVLDRVRAWEDQEARRGERLPVQGFHLGDFLRNLSGQIAGARLLAPVRLAGAVALGLVGGFVIGQQGFLTSRVAPVAGIAEQSITSSRAREVRADTFVPTTSTPSRPFADLAAGIPAVGATEAADDSAAAPSDDLGSDPLVYTGGASSHQVSVGSGDARPRVIIKDGRPQITF